MRDMCPAGVPWTRIMPSGGGDCPSCGEPTIGAGGDCANGSVPDPGPQPNVCAPGQSGVLPVPGTCVVGTFAGIIEPCTDPPFPPKP